MSYVKYDYGKGKFVKNVVDEELEKDMEEAMKTLDLDYKQNKKKKN